MPIKGLEMPRSRYLGRAGSSQPRHRSSSCSGNNLNERTPCVTNLLDEYRALQEQRWLRYHSKRDDVYLESFGSGTA